MKYRADIDGLRAIAVLAVLGFHFFPGKFKGGFVGVDIFFVISGYLITAGLILSSHVEGSYFLDFYARRIKRIFPALFVVIATSLVVGHFFLFPEEYEQLGKYASAGVAFITNFFLWKDVGYFDNLAELKPFLHLWSLSIEEQFYLLWPVVLFFSQKKHLNIFSIVLLFIFLSLYFEQSKIHSDSIEAFYSPIARFWEILVGSLLAYLSLNLSKNFIKIKERLGFYFKKMIFDKAPPISDIVVFDNVISWVGLFLITYSFLFIRKEQPFPGILALLPTLGTFFIISSSENAWPNSVLLSNRFMVGIGLISYPLYLWHWPIISFINIINPFHFNFKLKIVAIGFSFLLATATYFFIERPYKNYKHGKLKIISLIFFMFITCLFGIYVTVTKGINSRKGINNSLELLVKIEWPELLNQTPGCLERMNFKSRLSYCTQTEGLESINVVIIGDSHANHFFPGLRNYYKQQGKGVVMLGDGARIPFYDSKIQFSDGITTNTEQDVINESLDFAINSDTVETIILASRWPLYFTGKGHKLGNTLNEEPSDLNLYSVERPEFRRNIDSFIYLMSKTFQILSHSKKEIIVFHSVPEFGVTAKNCFLDRPFFKSLVTSNFCTDMPINQFELRTHAYREEFFKILQKYPRIKVFDPGKYICNSNNCSMIKDNILLYRDDDHLSQAGSDYIAKKFSVDFYRF